MVNVVCGPVQPFAKGPTVIVATTGTVPELIAVNDGIFPTPLSAKPMEGLLLLQTKVVPATGPLKLTAVVDAPLHTTWLATGFTLGVGLTVMVKVICGPVQPFAKGPTVMVATTGAIPELIARKDGIFPVPLEASPMDGVSLLQTKVVPATGPLKLTADVACPLHNTWLAMGLTDGVGFTVIVKVIGIPVHPVEEGVTVIVAVTGAAPRFVAVNDGISPVPVNGRPMEGVSLNQE